MNELEQAIQWLAQAERLVVLTGAGVSKESGVPTFRDAQEGLWGDSSPQALASRAGFRRDPGLVWRWYAGRSSLVHSVQPNPAHHALARLATLKPLTIITQNVDGLHQAAGSPNVLELHGNIRRYKCFAHGHPMAIADLSVAEPPPCPRCGSLARPDVVWFGELLPAAIVEQAWEAAARCDGMLVVGTSGVVQPAASLPLVAAQGGARTIEVNPEASALSHALDLTLLGPAGAVVPQLVDGVARLLSG